MCADLFLILHGSTGCFKIQNVKQKLKEILINCPCRFCIDKLYFCEEVYSYCTQHLLSLYLYIYYCLVLSCIHFSAMWWGIVNVGYFGKPFINSPRVENIGMEIFLIHPVFLPFNQFASLGPLCRVILTLI